MVKTLPVNEGDARDMNLIPALGRSPGVGNGNPLLYSCLGNPMDRGAQQGTVHGAAQSQTQLSLHATRSASDFPQYFLRTYLSKAPRERRCSRNQRLKRQDVHAVHETRNASQDSLAIRRVIECASGPQQSRSDWELLNCKEMGFMWIKTPRRNRQFQWPSALLC